MEETEIKTPTLTEQFMAEYHFAQQNLDILRANNAIKIAKIISGVEGKRLLVYAVLNGLVILDQNSTELKKKIESEIVGTNRSKALDMYLFDTLQSFQEVYKDKSQDLNFKTILKDQEFEFCETKRILMLAPLFAEVVRSYSKVMLHDTQRHGWFNVALELFGDVAGIRQATEREIFSLFFNDIKSSIINDAFFPEITTGGFGLGDASTFWDGIQMPFEVVNKGVHRIFCDFINRRDQYKDVGIREHAIECVYRIHNLHKSLREILVHERQRIGDYLEDRAPDVYKSNFKLGNAFDDSGIKSLFEKYLDGKYETEEQWRTGIRIIIESVYNQRELLPRS